MGHAYRELIEQEAKRTEDDLSAFRARSLAVVTTSSGIVTLITAAVTFGASKSEVERGISDGAIVVMVIGIALLLAAAILALMANRAGDIQRPSGADLKRIVTSAEWSKNSSVEQEREVAETLATYVVSVRKVSDRVASSLNRAILLQIAGVLVAAVAGIIILLSID